MEAAGYDSLLSTESPERGVTSLPIASHSFGRP